MRSPETTVDLERKTRRDREDGEGVAGAREGDGEMDARGQVGEGAEEEAAEGEGEAAEAHVEDEADAVSSDDGGHGEEPGREAADAGVLEVGEEGEAAGGRGEIAEGQVAGGGGGVQGADEQVQGAAAAQQQVVLHDAPVEGGEAAHRRPAAVPRAHHRAIQQHLRRVREHRVPEQLPVQVRGRHKRGHRQAQ